MSAAPTLAPVLPEAGVAHDVTDAEGRAWLERVYAPPAGRFVRLNMITTLTGSAVGSDGTSETLSSRADRTVLGVIRGHADVVVVGAQTVRAEGYLMPRAARLAVVTTSGDLSGHRLSLSDDADPVLVVCAASRAELVRRRLGDLHAEMVPIRDGSGNGELAPPAILDALAERGLVSVVCEGGPALAGHLLAAGSIDEACVTVAPLLTPVQAPFVAIDPEAKSLSSLHGMLVDAAGFSYLRLRAPA